MTLNEINFCLDCEDELYYESIHNKVERVPDGTLLYKNELNGKRKVVNDLSLIFVAVR